jgi:hypothetical protein
MLAFRTLGVSITVLAQHLSGPMRLWSSDANGRFVQLTDTDLADAERRVELWLALERESLDEAATPPVGEALPEPVDQPPSEKPPAAAETADASTGG